MDTEVDLTTVDRDVLIARIVRQQAIIARLEERIAQLEGQGKPANSRRMPGLKPNAKADRKPAPPKGPRKPRPHGFARCRMTPTRRVEDVVERCPDCGAHRSGGWTHCIREVIELPVVPAQVTEHVYIARTCPACRRRCTPPAELGGVVLGQQRLGVNLLSLIATLREEGRMPFRTIQRYLDTVHQLRLSVGAIVSAIHRTAQRAQPAVAAILDRIRGSPVVHADETGWREDGANGYVWTFSTPTERYFLRRGRGKAVVDEALGESFSGVLVSDFYAAYHHYDGPKQRCWAHPCSSQGQALLRDIHDQRTRYPDDAPLARWADAVHGIYDRAKACTHPQAKRRRTARLAWERQLLALCQPFRDDPSATQAKLCRRIERHLKSLPRTGYGNSSSSWPNPQCLQTTTMPPSAACDIWSSAARSAAVPARNGARQQVTLASLFGTWRVQGLNPLTACRQLLRSPQV